MRNRIITLCLREIKKNKKRFISLAVLSFLGVCVFVGVKLAGPDMIQTLDTYYDTNNVYDIRVISTLGLTDEDIESINNLDDRLTVYGTHSKDMSIKLINNQSANIKIIELDNNSKVLQLEGRFPENKNEIVVEKSLLKKLELKIGDDLTLNVDDNDKTINSKQLKIVGTVISPNYIFKSSGEMSRGSTTIGNGKINFYTFVSRDFFNMDYYTEININISNDYVTNSEKYNALINEITDKLENIKKIREKERYNQIVNEANDEIEKKEREALEEFDIAKEQLDNANFQLDSWNNLLNSSDSQLKALKEKMDSALDEIQKGNKKINESEIELNNAKIQLDNAVDEINLNFKKYQLDYNDLLTIKKAIEGVSLTKEEVISLIPTDLKYYNDLKETVNYIYDNGYSDLLKNFVNEFDREKIIEIIPTSLENYDDVCNYIRTVSYEQIKKETISYLLDSKNAEKNKQLIPNKIIGYNYIIKAIDKYEITVDQIVDLFNKIEQIRAGYIEYNNSIKELEEGKNKLQDGYNQYLKYLKEYEDALALLNSKKDEYRENLQEYQNKVEEYNTRKLDFEKNIEDARNKSGQIEAAKWYIFNRKDNSDYMSYLNSAQSIENVSILFPTVFYAVAVFISLLSMSRMAFEDRGEIGTLKSLGFNNMQIRFKYIIYSLLATLIGGILGAILGYYFITLMIFEAYGILYDIPIFIYSSNLLPIFIGIFISILCICGATVITINNLIKEKTANLLRPKAPLIGKTILLEKIRFIWSKFSFSNKVTFRNIFRYKKRITMTILGIVGCTMLLLSGYAIRDSIVNIVGIEYSEVLKYDNVVYLNSNMEDSEREDILNNDHIKQKVYVQERKVKTSNLEINLFVPDNEDIFNKIFILKDRDSKEQLKLENNQVVITSKMAKLLKLKESDILEFTDVNNKKYSFEISAIAQNYIGDYIFMNKETYEKNIEKYKISSAYIKIDDIANENDVTTNLLKNANVLGVVSIDVTVDNLSKIFSSLDTIVVILVVFSGALAFVVLYNLAYINISERQREIATLKVLGFNNREIDSYIIKEEIIITIIGILIGLIIGTWFGMAIVETVEIDLVEFIKNITIISYLKTFGFMILFSMIVNIRVHFALKKIDMIESLKSVE